MNKRAFALPRQVKPELEHVYSRSPKLGYEPPEEAGVVRCLSHGFPTELDRWHFHDEYELHLITQTNGKAFVGDWIGPFAPGHLVLCGPRLPHNWVSMDAPEGGVSERDYVIQFDHDPIASAAKHLPELAELMPLLERAKHGIEFFGLGDAALTHWHRVKAAKGTARMAAFFDFLAMLVSCSDYRLLSNIQLQGAANDEPGMDLINQIVNRITDNLSEPVSMADVANEMGMSETRFSRFFRKATGNSYTDFVNRIRVHRACHLLMETDKLVADICYEVGFNNVANFNRRFLEAKGMTPSEFRRQSVRRFGTRKLAG
ncbi:MAG: AraC family transcriptional regulator [Burkholderiaceae bacterium]